MKALNYWLVGCFNKEKVMDGRLVDRGVLLNLQLHLRLPRPRLIDPQPFPQFV
ncbi:hypothetical protein MBOL_12350 [Mycobacteroides abscessus subsp. bolletii BD]|nr:hypothetical protein MBOL_12350 [Mycobacteroides abscessus subsp. bolletii BD]